MPVYEGYAVEDATVQRYLEQWWSGSRTDNLVGDVCGDYRGYGMSMRFTGLNIPAGATIQEAYLIMTFLWFTTADGLEGTKSFLRCEDTQNPVPISSYEDHMNRPRTQWYKYWANPPAHTTDIEVQSPSIAGGIQEIVDEYNGTGDALTVFWEDPYMESNDGRHRHVASIEHPTYPSAKLHIEYLGEVPAYYHGLKIQGEGELALCDVGTHPLRIRKGGTTYGIELVATDAPNASRIRIKTGTGIKAIRKYS